MCEFCGAHSDESSATNIRTEMMTKYMEMMRENRADSQCGCGCGSASGEGEDAFSRQVMTMMEIIPGKLEMILRGIPEEKKPDFVAKMLRILMKEGCAGMSADEKRGFVSGVISAESAEASTSHRGPDETGGGDPKRAAIGITYCAE